MMYITKHKTAAALLLVLGGAALLASCAAGGVAVKESEVQILYSGYVEIGGMEQWLMARGASLDNPVLLWLHGGPGSSQSPVASYPDERLEELFTVVHWDQRGAGKSNPRSFDESTMTVDTFVGDARELTLWLKNHFGKEKIVLLGHSWGTVIGMLLAQRYPEDYLCYIGVSQVVDTLRSHAVAHAWASEQEGAGKLGTPPYTDHGEYVRFAKKIDSLGGGMDVGFGTLLRQALAFDLYGFSDLLRWMNGANRGSGPMWEEYLELSLPDTIGRVDIPVLFFSGRHDYNTPLELVEEYFRVLEAPEGSELIIFPDSAHTPFWKERETFLEEMARVRRVYCR